MECGWRRNLLIIIGSRSLLVTFTNLFIFSFLFEFISFSFRSIPTGYKIESRTFLIEWKLQDRFQTALVHLRMLELTVVSWTSCYLMKKHWNCKGVWCHYHLAGCWFPSKESYLSLYKPTTVKPVITKMYRSRWNI